MLGARAQPHPAAAPAHVRWIPVRLIVLAACVLLAITGCATARADRAIGAAKHGQHGGSTVYGPVPRPQPELTPHLGSTCLPATGFSCTMWGRISQVKRYLATRAR